MLPIPTTDPTNDTVNGRIGPSIEGINRWTVKHRWEYNKPVIETGVEHE